MVKGKANKKVKPKIKIDIPSNDTSTVLTECSLNIEENVLEEGALKEYVNFDIEKMKQQHTDLSSKHDDLLGLPSNLSFVIDPNQPTRYKILRSFLKELCGLNKEFTESEISDKEKFKLRNMHKKYIKAYIDTASITLQDHFPPWRLLQFPAHLSSEDKRILQETLMAADFVKEKLKEEKNEPQFIRILSFEVSQTREELIYRIQIPGIGNYDRSNLTIQFEQKERSFSFIVKDCSGVNYIFERKYLANNIAHKNLTYDLLPEDFVQIHVYKKKKNKWRYVDDFFLTIRKNWELEMNYVIKKISVSEDNLRATELIWKVVVDLVHGGTDFLNLPDDLNHVKRSFQSLEDMIWYYMAFFSIIPILIGPALILAGAIYAKLLSSTVMNNESQYIPSLMVENEQTSIYVYEITEIMKAAVMKVIDGLNLYHCDKFDEAFEQLCTAIDMFPHPKFFCYRSRCLLGMKKYDAAYSDSIKALKSFGPIAGFDCMIICLHLEIEQLKFIRALDLSYSLPFVVEEVSEDRKEELTFIRKKALNRLRLQIEINKLILIKKFDLSIPLLEKLANVGDFNKIKLGLLYIMFQNYEEANKIANLITNKSCEKDALYILGMSSYFFIDIDQTISYFKRMSHIEISFISKVQRVKSLIDKGDKYLQSGCLSEAINSYLCIFQYETKNVRLLSLIFLWVGYLELRMENYSGAKQAFSSSIHLNDSVEAIRLKDVACRKLENKDVAS